MEYLQKTFLTLLNELLDLALLNDLELRLLRHLKVSSLEDIDQVFLSDNQTIEMIVLLVGLTVVRLTDDQVGV